MNKINLKTLLPLILALTLAIGVFIGNHMGGGSTDNRLFRINYTERDKINDIINFIKSDYVDQVNQEDLTEKTVSGLLKNLDPHSSYIPPRDLKAIEESMNGNFFGIGVQFRQWNDTVIVVKTINGGPSEKAGIKAGDRLIAADDIDITGNIGNDSIMKLLKGPSGTRVIVSVFRPSTKEIKDIEIYRGAIPYESVTASYLVNDSTAYIKLERFAATSYDEFMQAANDLGIDTLSNLLVDLQNNGGGLLNIAAEIIDEFLPKGRIIVYTQGNNRPKETIYSTSNEEFKGVNVKVLMNENSASASEIFAGAIQDNDRGLIVGRRSFGKGLVQEQVTLADGSAVRLTVARYYTASGRCIQRSYKDGSDNYYHEIVDRYSNGEMMNPDSIHWGDTIVYKTIGGRLVHAGGGIMPDIFVPLDTSKNYRFYNALLRNGLFDFSFEYVDKHRKEILKKYPSEDAFVQDFMISKSMMHDLLKYSKERGLISNTNVSNEMWEEIKVRLKGQMASDIYGAQAYYRITNLFNDVFVNALKETKGLPIQ